MNDSMRKQLRAIVERAVQPVRAAPARKQQIREELLCHVVSVFEEEAERLGDEQAAFRRTKERFGESGELSGQLQQAVPRWERYRSALEGLGHQSGESIWQLAARHFRVMLMLYAVILPVGLPIMVAFGQSPGDGRAEVWLRGALQLTVSIYFAAVLLNTTISLTLALILDRFSTAPTSTRWGRSLVTVLCCLAFPFVLVATFAGSAVVFLLMAREATQRWHHQDAWG